MLAFLASHVAAKRLVSKDLTEIQDINDNVLATSVLLNRALTFGALLGVTLDPVRSFAVVSTLLEPHLRHTAYHGSMIALDRASKAEFVLRGSVRTTCDSWNDCRQRAPGRRGRTGDGVCA